MRPTFQLALRASRRSALPLTSGRRVTSASYGSKDHLPSDRRHLFGLFGGGKGKKGEGSGSGVRDNAPVLLAQDDLFHPLSQSPIPAMRARAQLIKSLAPCPVTLNRDGVRKLVQFECPECGWPTHFSEKEWTEDTEHGKYVGRLREANEDEHDLRSGREMTEFKLPGPQGFEEVINFSSWDIFFYTRNHDSIETERSRRHVSKLLSFPCSIAGALHENSPYTKRNGRLTHEGLRSLVALRQTLHPVLGSRPSLDVVRIFVVGARAESTLPHHVWDQLSYMFPGVALHIFLIGPEVTIPKDSSSSANSSSTHATTSSMHRGKQRTSNYGVPSRSIVVSEGLTLTTIQSNYEDVHALFEPFDPYTDVYFCFSPGFGFPSQIGQDEVNRARWEARDEKARMDAARETYFARRAPATIDDITGGADGVQQTLNPVGGDIPAAEPPPPPPPPTTAEQPQGRYTSLTTAPIVQAEREWARALGQMLSTKCAVISTGFSPADIERDILAFERVEGIQGEFEWLVNPGENVFASQQWAVADFDPRVAVKANWGIWAVRGKRYDIEGPSLWSGGWRGAEED